jgi:hypothetical protein
MPGEWIRMVVGALIKASLRRPLHLPSAHPEDLSMKKLPYMPGKKAAEEDVDFRTSQIHLLHFIDKIEYTVM